MAWVTSKWNIVKILLIVYFYLQVSRKCHILGTHDSSKEYVFSPNVILQVLEQSCFIGISKSALDREEISKVYSHIKKALADEDIVVIGLLNAEHFVWPSGKSLKINGGNPNSSPEILSFPKREVDRTCLSTGNLAKPDPVAESFTGIKTVDILVEFINQKCNTYRTKHGYLSVEGLHRQEILSSLFKVKEISEFDIKKLLTESDTRKGQYCSKIDCRKEINKISSLEDSDMRLQSEKSKDAGYMIASDLEHLLNFKDEELNIAKCEHAPLPSKDKFFHEYLKRSKPVIFKNAITHWPAMKKWTNEYFRTHYGDRFVHIKLTPLGKLEGVDFASNFENYNDFNIPPVVKEQLLFPDLVVVRPAEANMNFSTFIDTYESVANGSRSKFSAYLEYSSISDIMPELQDDIIEMPFMQKTLHLEHLNMWLSDGNTLGKLHFDPFDNFLCQISGRKQVIMFEPHDNTALYEAHIPEAKLTYNSTNNTFHKKRLVDTSAMVMSPVDIINPDLERFPLFGKVYPLNCTIDEGDVLFMPAFWWHEVQSYPNMKQGRNLAVNFWYEPFLQKEFPCQDCKLDINPKYRHLL